MTAVQRVFKSRRVVCPEGVGAASIHVGGGRILGVDALESHPRDCDVVDAGEAVILPGLVDTHVHINEPGRTHWEGFRTATRAAAAGGVTTLVDMPLNSIPATTTAAALEAKVVAALGQCWVDVGLWGGVVPGNCDDLADLVAGGALGFKCFLVPSGVDEFAAVSEADLRAAMPILTRLGAPLLVHAELPGPIDAARPVDDSPGERRRYASYLASRPPAAENEAIALVLSLAAELGTRVHIVHLASAEALPALRAARAAGLAVTVETCPHYLTFAAELIPDGATAFKCAPPIRESAHRERLWAALDEGLIDLIATDHSPSTPELKCLDSGDFRAAWGGIASIQLSLSVVWTAARARGHELGALARWMATAPARLAGLEGRKGVISPGADADLVFFDPEASFTVEPGMLYHRHPVTPYAGETLMGRVQATFLRGRRVFDGKAPGREATGHWLAGGKG